MSFHVSQQSLLAIIPTGSRRRSQRLVAQLRDYVGANEIKELDYGLSQGDNVQITEGAFAGLEAVVTLVLPARERVKILMDFLGRKVEAEVECASLLWQAA